jgi:hypothetical protein
MHCSGLVGTRHARAVHAPTAFRLQVALLARLRWARFAAAAAVTAGRIAEPVQPRRQLLPPAAAGSPETLPRCTRSPGRAAHSHAPRSAAHTRARRYPDPAPCDKLPRRPRPPAAHLRSAVRGRSTFQGSRSLASPRSGGATQRIRSAETQPQTRPGARPQCVRVESESGWDGENRWTHGHLPAGQRRFAAHGKGTRRHTPQGIVHSTCPATIERKQRLNWWRWTESNCRPTGYETIHAR